MLTWKLDDGIHIHVDIREQNKPNQFSLGRSLWIGNDVSQSLSLSLSLSLHPPPLLSYSLSHTHIYIHVHMCICTGI